MKTGYFAGAGALAYLLFLVIYTPATLVQQVGDQQPQLKLQGLNGTLWNGSAQKVTFASKHEFEDINWSFCLWRLLTAEICLNLEAKYQNQPVQAQLGARPGSIQLRNLKTETDAGTLGKMLGLPLGELSGMVSIDISSASWSQGYAPIADGTITWNNAAITVAETAQLGAVAIALTEGDEQPLSARISNKGGQVSLDGSAHVLENGTYNIELNLTPTSEATKNIRSSLEMFAKKQANGSFVLKNSGNLTQFGLM